MTSFFTNNKLLNDLLFLAGQIILKLGVLTGCNCVGAFNLQIINHFQKEKKCKPEFHFVGAFVFVTSFLYLAYKCSQETLFQNFYK